MGAEEKNIIAEKGKPKEHQLNQKPRPSMPRLKPDTHVDKMKVDSEKMAKAHQAYVDLCRLFLTVFDNDAGKKLLDHLDKYSHKNFPNYDNVNATYSKIGEQTLVAHIKDMLFRAKGGE